MTGSGNTTRSRASSDRVTLSFTFTGPVAPPVSRKVKVRLAVCCASAPSTGMVQRSAPPASSSASPSVGSSTLSMENSPAGSSWMTMFVAPGVTRSSAILPKASSICCAVGAISTCSSAGALARRSAARC